MYRLIRKTRLAELLDAEAAGQVDAAEAERLAEVLMAGAGHVWMLYQRGVLHSVHVSAESAEDAAVVEGASPGWVWSQPATVWRMERLPVGGPHAVRVTGQLWSCTCGAGGRQPDEQRARIAARLHQSTAGR